MWLRQVIRQSLGSSDQNTLLWEVLDVSFSKVLVKIVILTLKWQNVYDSSALFTTTHCIWHPFITLTNAHCLAFCHARLAQKKSTDFSW